MDCPSCGAHNILGAEHCVQCGSDLSNIISSTPVPDFIREPLAALPSRDAAQVGPTDPVGLAVARMRRENTDFVLVMDGARLVGIITSFDILHKVAGTSEDLNAVTCAQFMTKDPVCLHQDDNMAMALNKMASGEFRHIPLLDSEGAVRVVTVADVFRHLSPHLT